MDAGIRKRARALAHGQHPGASSTAARFRFRFAQKAATTAFTRKRSRAANECHDSERRRELLAQSLVLAEDRFLKLEPDQLHVHLSLLRGRTSVTWLNVRRRAGGS
jgi:hypothetical protein